MAFAKKKLDPQLQDWLRKVAAEGRSLLYGQAGCPEWGTKFSEIEKDGMSVGLELARLVMEQAVHGQAEQMPTSAREFAGDEALPAGKEPATLITEAGEVIWDEPRTRLKQGRKAFFPPTASAGTGSQ
jgi:hypothetical protein